MLPSNELGIGTCCAPIAELNPWQWLTPTGSSPGGVPAAQDLIYLDTKASDLNYLDTKQDGQIEGTNGPLSQSRALSFSPWLLLSMLQLGILPCAV